MMGKGWIISLGTALLVSGCGLVVQRQDCAASATRPGTCAVINAPLALSSKEITVADRAFPFRETENAVTFLDDRGVTWTAPRGTLTDGASIPPVFVPVVGHPTSAEFRVAAAVHDAYCGYGNDSLAPFQSRPWHRVHRMFYHALVVGGTPPKKAKAMYAAVMLGGPRWSLLRDSSGEGGLLPQGHSRPALAGVPPEVLQDQLRLTVAEIEAKDLSLDQIDRRIKQNEAQAIEIARQLAQITPANPGGWSADGTYRPAEEKGFKIDRGTVIEWQGQPEPFDPNTGETYDGTNLPPGTSE